MRWLLLPEEWKDLRQQKSPTAAISFIERFWRRRDPTPLDPGNLFREAFYRRVEEADLLYGEPGLRGSLSDRGRALVLLGPPSHLQIRSKPVLRWDARKDAPRRVTTRELALEVWGYRLEDLPAGLADAAREQKLEEALPLTLTFRSHSRRTVLEEGETLLELAVRAAVFD